MWRMRRVMVGGRCGALSTSAVLLGLDKEQLRLLRRVGREWGRVSAPEAWHRALPVDSDLGRFRPLRRSSLSVGIVWSASRLSADNRSPPTRPRESGPLADWAAWLTTCGALSSGPL